VLVDVTVDTDGDAGDAIGTVTATANHPFWLPSRRAWVDAGRLHRGQWLRTSAGTWVQVIAVKRRAAHATVHNLTVAGHHTFHVKAGAVAVLVHNCGDLARDEGVRGAHVLRDHVNVTDDVIRARARREGQDIGRWVDQSTAQQVIDYELAFRSEEINRWVSRAARGGDGEHVIVGQFGPNGSAPLGSTASPDGRVTPSSNTYRIVLRYVPGHRRGFVVYTAYPTGRR
jgi:hypothetical protein